MFLFIYSETDDITALRAVLSPNERQQPDQPNQPNQPRDLIERLFSTMFTDKNIEGNRSWSLALTTDTFRLNQLNQNRNNIIFIRRHDLQAGNVK